MENPGETITTDAGASSPPAGTPSTSDELISTVELSPAMDADQPPPEGAKNGADEDATASGQEDGGEQTSNGQDVDKTPSDQDDSARFDKHPRFVELNRRMKAAEETNRQLLDRIDALSKPSTTQADTSPKDLPYKDISAMTEEDLLDWQSEDPKGYIDNINKMVEYRIEQSQQALLEKSQQASQMKDYETRVELTYDSYSKENPDFEDMWNSGDLQRFMDENPGHTAISAHQQLTQDQRVQEAVKEALKKAESDRRSTRKAGAVLGAGPGRSSSPAPGSDDELKQPSKYGGKTSVLAARLAKRRADG